MSGTLLRIALAGLVVGSAGCGGDARVELTAGDTLHAVAGQMSATIEEYHREVSQYDETRESSTVAAFVARVRGSGQDDAAVERHVGEFEAALRKIRGDRESEWARRQAAVENVGVLREVARGLQKLAIQSLSLQDEMKRYLESWIAMRERGAEVRKSESQQVGK